MMVKGLITCMAVAAAAFLLLFLKKSADIARNRSDQLLKEFKTIDNSLQPSGTKSDSVNKTVPDSLNRPNK
ncbi:MAG: hypothetical protein ACKOU7_13250 [Ferruginibacter sp.]